MPNITTRIGLCVLVILFLGASTAGAVVLCRSILGFVKAREGSCKRWEREIPAQNAVALCGSGEILDGDGSCIPVPVNTDTLAALNCSNDEIAKFNGTAWECAPIPVSTDTDTNAATECSIGYVLLGGGACLDMRAEFAEQECSSGFQFVDLGLTVFDCDTNLEWGKKVAGPSGSCLDNDKIHSVDATCDWDEATGGWVDKLNTTCSNDPSLSCTTDADCSVPGGPCGYAGYTNWRIPEMERDGGAKELETLLLPEPFPCGTSPCIDPIFGPTAANLYWSSIPLASTPTSAWSLLFTTGSNQGIPKFENRSVRAVRTGP